MSRDAQRPRNTNFIIRAFCTIQAGNRATTRELAYILHLGERSNDLKRLPMASCRQCQTSALWFGGDLSPLCFDSLLLACRGDGATETILALAFCQCRSAAFLTIWGVVGGVSA